MSTFNNHELFQTLGTWHALNELGEVATLRRKFEEVSPESLDTQQSETSASWWASNQRSCATTTTLTFMTTVTTTATMTTMTTMPTMTARITTTFRTTTTTTTTI